MDGVKKTTRKTKKYRKNKAFLVKEIKRIKALKASQLPAQFPSKNNSKNIIDLRKLRKKLRLLGFSKTWIERLIFPIKSKRNFEKSLKQKQKNLPKTFRKKANSIKKYCWENILGRKKKRGRPRKKTPFKFNFRFKLRSKKKASKKIKKDFRVNFDFKTIFSLEFLRKAIGFYINRPWQLLASLIFSGLLLSGSYFTYERILKDLPMPGDLISKEQIVTTRILDRNGRVLFKIYKDENRTLIPLARIPEHVKQATIAIEDKNFYYHHGFSLIGIARAATANFQGKPVQGGSTITQQLVKNRLLSPERTVERKIREILVAILVEGTFTKDEILEMYFNEIAYGGAIYGIEEASQKYFGKSASELSLAEGVLLAGLPAAPSAYTPFGSNPELSYARQAEVLRRMVEDGYITKERAKEASAEKLEFKSNRIDILAPHFVMYIKELLAERYGEATVNQGGLEVRTTLDFDLQTEAQQIVSEELTTLRRLNIKNGAALVTNPETGEILSMVGSKDYFDFENDGQVNVTLRPRQPGSSIKPITYALTLENGKTPISLIADTPITYQTVGSPPYSPRNYDGKYHGNVPLKLALANSYNIPAVKLLAMAGVDEMIDKAEMMGITTWQDRKRFGLALTLGGGEVLMADMAQVYGTFANGGHSVPLDPFLEVKNAQGEILYRNQCVLDSVGCFGETEAEVSQKKVLDPKIAYQITNILSDNQARTPAFGAYSVLNIPDQEVAVKTGTTNSMRDNWTIGYTSDRVVAVWVGNNDNTPMSFVASGITGASPIWNKIMRLNLSEEEPHKFASPSGMIKVPVCAAAGTLPCSGCKTTDEYFIEGTQPFRHCNSEWFNSLKEI